MAKHGHIYKDNLEKKMCCKISKDNIEFLENSKIMKNRNYQLSFNEFADMTNDEFLTYYID